MAVVAGSTNPLKAEELVLKPGGYQPLDPAKKVRIGVVGGGFGSRMFWNFEPNCIVRAVSDGVDLVFIADCSEDGSDHLQLATPGLEKGIPTAIDKPIANEVGNVDKIMALSKKHHAPVFSASILHHLPGAFQFRAQLPDVRKIDCATIRGLRGQIHAVSLAEAIFGGGIETVHTMGPGPLGVMHLSRGDRPDRPKSGVAIQNGDGRTYIPLRDARDHLWIPRGHPVVKQRERLDLPRRRGEYHQTDQENGCGRHCRKRRRNPSRGPLKDMIEAVRVVNAGRLSSAKGSRPGRVDEVR